VADLVAEVTDDKSLPKIERKRLQVENAPHKSVRAQSIKLADKISNLRSMLKARLVARRPVNYVDATNLTPHDRHSWIKLAKDYGYDVQGVYFDVPVEVCLERNQKRERVVAEDVMRRMAGKLKAPTFEEGFSKITVVRVKQKEA